MSHNTVEQRNALITAYAAGSLGAAAGTIATRMVPGGSWKSGFMSGGVIAGTIAGAIAYHAKLGSVDKAEVVGAASGLGAGIGAAILGRPAFATRSPWATGLTMLAGSLIGTLVAPRIAQLVD